MEMTSKYEAREPDATSRVTGSYDKFPETVRFLGGESMMNRKIITKLDVHHLIQSGFRTVY